MKKPFYHQTYINTGHGPTVILLHGLFGNLGIWKSAIDALKPRYHVIVPRLPLFDLPADQTSIRHVVEALRDLIEFHQLRDVTLVGHALGGQVAMAYAHLEPENVKGIVLVASAGLAEKSPVLDSAGQDTTAFHYVHDKISEAFYERGHISGELVQDIYAMVQSIPKRVALWNIARSSRQFNISTLLPRIQHPVLLLWGLQDKITPPEVALHFHDYLTRSELKFINECGHVPMVEKPDEFTTHLLSFVDTHCVPKQQTIL